MPTEKPNLMAIATGAGMSQEEFKNALITSLCAITAVQLVSDMVDNNSPTPHNSARYFMHTETYGQVAVTVDFEDMSGVSQPTAH